jgi:hypothetical protein
MRIYNPVGSKDRLLEIFQKVNNLKLNESMFESNGQDNGQNVLNNAFNQLKNNGLNVLKQDTQGGDDSFLQLNCKDNQGNNIIFRFETNSSEGDQEGVYNVNKTALINFVFNSARGDENIELGKNELQDFNSEHGNELFDVIDKYVDIESDEDENYDELAEAIKLIDAIKQDSYPFGGSPDDLQTGKGYADENPVNPALRVKSPQLDNFIQEGDDYPSEMPKGFSTRTERKKTKKAHKKTIKLSEEELTSDENPDETPELDIDQLSQDQEETGNMLQGGIGDEKSPSDFDYDQVLMGLEVEKEHSDNPMVALEIVLDHLTEDPQYYTTGENPEDSAQQNASMEASGEEDMTNPDKAMGSPVEFAKNFQPDDKEMTDLLLGYKPMNVGESYDYNDEKGYEANDRYSKYLQMSQMPFENIDDNEKEEFFQLWQEFKGAEDDMAESYDYNDEKGYEANDRYKKYLAYKQMDIETILDLPDEQFEEYSNLTNEFKGAENNEMREAAINPQELERELQTEKYINFMNALKQKFENDIRFSGINIDRAVKNVAKMNHLQISNAPENTDMVKMANDIFDKYSKEIMGNKQSTNPQQVNPQQQAKNTTQNLLNRPEYKGIIGSVKDILRQQGIPEEEMDTRTNDILRNNFVKISTGLAANTPVNLLAKMITPK